MRCYGSRVEHGHTVPTLETIEKWAKALDAEMCRLFSAGKGKPDVARVTPAIPTPHPRSEQATLLKVFDRMSKPDRRLLLALARKMAAPGKRGRVSVAAVVKFAVLHESLED